MFKDETSMDLTRHTVYQM